MPADLAALREQQRLSGGADEDEEEEELEGEEGVDWVWWRGPRPSHAPTSQPTASTSSSPAASTQEAPAAASSAHLAAPSSQAAGPVCTPKLGTSRAGLLGPGGAGGQKRRSPPNLATAAPGATQTATETQTTGQQGAGKEEA